MANPPAGQRVRTGVRVAVVLAVLLVFSGAGLASAPGADAAPAELQRYLEKLTNQERRDAGKRALRSNAGLQSVAVGWTKKMVSRTRLAHNPRRVPQVDNRVTTRWRRLGENVGYASASGASNRQLALRVHRALMKSPGHRANILGDYNRIGIGVRIDSARRLWITQVFMKI